MYRIGSDSHDFEFLCLQEPHCNPVKMMVVNFPCLLRRSRIRAAPVLSLQAPLILQRLTVGVRNSCMHRPLHSIALAATTAHFLPQW